MNNPIPKEVEPVSHYSIVQVCAISAVEKSFVVELVQHGVIDPEGDVTEPDQWQFTQTQVSLCKRAANFYYDFQVNIQGIELAIRLLDELEQLRAKVKLLEDPLK
ncbi:MAG: chaperone modulator CbpM [Candidatus Brocadiaceae bacterium]|nr:chaperone modulator CbpM [Candidatus Brocadiaceae bacterium]